MRHKPFIQIWKRVFQEAGIIIPDRNVERILATTHIRRGPNDFRRMDLITPGIDGIFGGVPLFVDVTIVSPLRGTGESMPGSAVRDGAAVQRAEDKNKHDDYPDVEESSTAQLLPLGVETYGRWNSQSLELVRQLAKKKSLQYPEILQSSVKHAYLARWWAMLSVGVQRLVGESILRPRESDLIIAAPDQQGIQVEDVLDFI